MSAGKRRFMNDFNARELREKARKKLCKVFANFRLIRGQNKRFN